MEGAKHQNEQAEKQAKDKAEIDLTRCAACYNYVPRHIDHDSSSSEGSGSEADCVSSSCSSSETDFEELWTQDTSAHSTVAPPVLKEEPENVKIEISERSANRRAVSLPSDSVLLESQSPRVVSVLNLQVLPPRHTYDPHYIIRRSPSHKGPSTPDERRETSPMEPSVAERQTPVFPLQCSVHWPQQLTSPPLLQSTPAAQGPALPFVPYYTHPQVYYGPHAPVHHLGSSQYYQPEPPQ